jgi:fatty-acyl-CoA synthase
VGQNSTGVDTGAQLLSMTSADCTLLITPMFHGQCWGLPQMAVLVASKIVLPGRYMAADTSVLVDAMVAEKVTITNGAPAIFQPMLDYIRTLPKAPDFSRMRMLSGATEPPLSLMRGLYDVTGADVIHVYGATETTPLVTVNRFKPTLAGHLSDEEQWDLRRYQGLLVSGVDFRLVDPAGKDQPWDGKAQGEILMRGPWIIESYHKQDDNAERFLDGWWRTGDVGKIDRNGYLKITDRIKDVIKSGGEWISSVDMENALAAHSNIAEVMVVGVPHPKWQERPLVFIKTRDGNDVPLAGLHQLLEGRFAKWQMPDRVIHLDALPRTSVGKPDKKVLRAQYRDIYAGADA